MLISFSAILIILVLLLIIYWYVYIYICNNDLASLPGPKPSLFWGNIKLFKSNLFWSIYNLIKDYGTVSKLWLSFKPVIIIANSKCVEQITHSSFKQGNSELYQFWKPLFDNGIISLQGNEWHRRRKFLEEIYNNVEVFIPILDKYSDCLVDNLAKQRHKDFDVFTYIETSAMNIIYEIALGKPLNPSNNFYDLMYIDTWKNLQTLISNRLSTPWKYPDFIYKLTKDYKLHREYIKKLHEHISTIYNQRKQEVPIKHENCKSLLNELLQKADDETPLSYNDILDELSAFIFTGHNAIASCIGFTLYEIANSPQIQGKLYQEQMTIFPNERQITLEDLNKMSYLDIVIKESLRLYPPIPFYAMKTEESMKIENRKIIPKNTTVLICPFYIHREIENFPVPNKFDPERFENCVPNGYLPFGMGKKNCLGKKLALTEIKAILSKLIRHFEILPASNIHQLQFQQDITILKPHNGIVLHLRERDMDIITHL